MTTSGSGNTTATVYVAGSYVTPTALRDFIGLDADGTTDAPTDDTLKIIIGYAEQIVDAYSSSFSTSQKFLLIMAKAGEMLFKRMSASKLKRGISSWSIEGISISYDLANITNVSTMFRTMFADFVNLFLGTSTGYGYVGQTNTGTGLALNSTQRDGPIYWSYGNGFGDSTSSGRYVVW